MIAVIFGIAFCAFLYWVCVTLGMPQPWLKITMVFLVIVALGIVLNYFGFNTGMYLK